MNPPPPESQPAISVVIASVNGLPSIAECLDCLSQQEGNIGYEVLVMDRCDAKTRQEIRRRFPQPEVHLVEEAGHPSIPKLRALGIAQARGQLIAILEDHCNVPPAWFRTIIRFPLLGCGCERLLFGNVRHTLLEQSCSRLFSSVA